MDDPSPPRADPLPEEPVEFGKPELQPGDRLLRAANSRPYPDGPGDVMFTDSAGRPYQSPSGFEGVAYVRLVEDRVRRTLFAPGPRPSA